MATLVLGIGNPGRGDDALGLEVARRLHGRVPAGVQVREHGGDGAALLDAFQGFSHVILVDALRGGAQAGDIVRLDASTAPLPARLGGTSTHLLGVAEAVELARVLGQLPQRILVLGVEGLAFTPNAPLSAPVALAVDAAVAAVLAELQLCASTHESAPPRSVP